ncbi:Hpt domain-containing protein [Burkholderia metallica]|uniref:Hpt domain-containing protein n=1 Tax=Burkholderia metallica TaxID=488729 RepID=UPI0014531E63|nr:integral membrane sensor hybrid histidine kinase [Burkholderia metallica]
MHSLTAIDTALSNDDADLVKIELHSMRGGFALAGATEARYACAHAKKVMTEGGIEAMKAAWPPLERQIECALERLSGVGPSGFGEPV